MRGQQVLKVRTIFASEKALDDVHSLRVLAIFAVVLG
jgi:hypothetical protein